MSNDPLGRRLVFTAKAVREAFEDTLHQAGGSLGTWVVLSALSDEGVISQSALGSHVHLEGATITHHIDRLEQLGLVRRQLDPKDRRVRNLELTAEGEQLHKNLLAAMRGFERKMLDGLGDRELTGLRKTLDRISANLS
ncbi:MAG TPA: MarR family transcriptional regulator [Gaiellaceae bacterium]|nr:MarR family transcriptional regulator [Gaiellaceae bacterium]